MAQCQPRRSTSCKQYISTASNKQHLMLGFADSQFPIPDSRDASITTHPVTQITCNRLQAFREGMCTTFVAILSFSPAAATGTT
ncbi:hypothetical protein XabCFBP2524_16345 [Xanthomonas axonopodis pv. begoniae]|nr:hypothetical protein XabCFBP2524_16345 [Xanthomonas axonopodis pv. begoniae]